MAKQTMIFDHFSESEYNQIVLQWELVGQGKVSTDPATNTRSITFDTGVVKWETLSSGELFTLIKKWPLPPAPITTTGPSSEVEVIEAEVLPTPPSTSLSSTVVTSRSTGPSAPPPITPPPTTSTPPTIPVSPPAPPEPEEDDDEDQPRRKGCRKWMLWGCVAPLSLGIGFIAVFAFMVFGPKEDQHAGAPVPNQAPTMVQPAPTPPATSSPEGTVVQEQEFDPKRITTIKVDQGNVAAFIGKISVTYTDGTSNEIDIATGSQSQTGGPKVRTDWTTLPCPALAVGQGYFKDSTGTCSTEAKGPGSFQAGVNVLPGEAGQYKSEGAKLQFRKLP